MIGIPRDNGWRYLGLAMLFFGLLGIDYFSLFVGKWLDGRPFSDPGIWGQRWFATVGMLMCSATVWTISTALIFRLHRRGGLGSSLFITSMDRRRWIAFFAGVLVLIVLAYWESSLSGQGFPSLAREYRAFERRYPEYGAAVTAAQSLYYLGESLVVFLILVFFQRAGEVWTGRVDCPWGGVGLTLTWGLSHFISHPEGAIWVVLSAVLSGLVFAGVRKSIGPTLAFLYLTFVL